MTIDTKHLRELAEKALEVESVGLEWHPVESLQLNCDFNIRDAEFIAATDPQAVLALVEEVERLRDIIERVDDILVRHYLDMSVATDLLPILAEADPT